MKKGFVHLTFLFVATLSTLPTFADDSPQNPDGFKPYKLVGNWQFHSSNSGRDFGGDIEVAIISIDSTGIMHGKISYDGRQTNDQCSTKELFNDKPAEVEIIKTNNDYRITFQVNCKTGVTPRVISWTLRCEEATCSRPEVQAWGKGVTVLTEKR